MPWPLTALLPLLGTALFFWWLTTVTITIHFPRGQRHQFISFHFGPRRRAVSSDRYERILKRFVEDHPFDCLWISTQDDPQGASLVLNHEEGKIQMEVYFRPLPDAERLATFEQNMSAAGLSPTETLIPTANPNKDHQALTLSYDFPLDAANLQKTIDQALQTLEGPPRNKIHLIASRNPKSPRNDSLKIGNAGLKIEKHPNLLTKVP